MVAQKQAAELRTEGECIIHWRIGLAIPVSLATAPVPDSLKLHSRNWQPRWKPILDVYDENGVDVAYELHPGEDVFDGSTFEMFVDYLGGHTRANINYDPSHFVLQQLDYLQFIDLYHDSIKAFHVKGRGIQSELESRACTADLQAGQIRAGRFRSLGDGQVDFGSHLSQSYLNITTIAGRFLEWECCIKSPVQGAAEGAPFIESHIIEVTTKAFDDFAGTGADEAFNRKVLGL
jgi:sugar phosphate isomerase/epimerase